MFRGAIATSCMNSRPRLAGVARWRAEFSSGRGRRGRWGGILLLSVLLFVPGAASLYSQMPGRNAPTEYDEAQQLDQYFAERNREKARAEQEKFRKQIAIPDVMSDEVPTLAAVQAANEHKAPPRPVETSFWVRWLMMLGVGILTGALLLLRFFPDTVERLKELLLPWDAMQGGRSFGIGDVRIESQAFNEFMAAFRTGPTPRAATEPALPPLEEFLAGWPRILLDLRKQLREVGNTPDTRIRRRYLRDLGRELRSVKGATGMPELLPVWQMACALEGLVRQLADKINEVTPSTLRTVGGGFDLLAELCQSSLDAQLLTRRPVRLLAVDDDPISRHALSFALKRALHAPDLAPGGEAGLVLAREHAYDVIFLDVEMPDVDGFELCTQIHQTATNRATPVVFVTSHSDFDARVQSTLSGGADLIAKPFLTFELAVKALTLTMQRRLKESKVGAEPTAPVVVTKGIKVDEAGSETIPSQPLVVAAPVPPLPEATLEPVAVVVPPVTSLQELAPAPTHDVEEIATEFLTRAPEHLGWVNELMRSALQQTDEAAWLPMLSDVYLRLHSFTPASKFAREHPVMQLSSALEKLLRKLLQSPTPPTKATLLTVTTAIELLRERCATASPQVPPRAAVQLLVVDDDPVARRAVLGTLQTMFDKPAWADNGLAALAQATERKFDAIFLDVQMPGMDGIEAFARLRSEGLNQETPIVFVCGRTDLGPVVEISAHGDCDIIAKPFLPAELLVKVLTLMLRRERKPNIVPA